MAAGSVPSRFVVGIDLGTTNTAVAYADTSAATPLIKIFAIPQVVSPGEVEAHEGLPSFHYQPASDPRARDALRLPWSDTPPDYVVGRFARDQGARMPGRRIASAKSWLCHTGVDRTAELLPWHGAVDVPRLSPVEVSGRYLAHLRSAWDARFPTSPLADQEVVLTLPASFDEIARQLTVRAAARAGLPRVVLIEEPQSAFYAWLYLNRHDWRAKIAPGQKILVCDVGGGTTDFTLIHVRQGDADQLQLHRVAVGDHLILGGDNLDLALAHHVEQQVATDTHLEARQWDMLVARCRQAKETLLGEDAPSQLTMHLPAAGARLMGGGRQVTLRRREVEQVLLDGFFPHVALDARPAARQSGFQEFGLPYAADPAMTRHLAAFLSAHRHAGIDGGEPTDRADPARPDAVLLNGGLFASPAIRRRLVDVVSAWFREDGTDSGWMPTVLVGDRLDLAVARGAAYYGMARRGEGVRITADLARSYFMGVEGGPAEAAGGATAVCLVPASTEPGHTIELTGRRFELTVSQPVEFPLYVSSTRLTDRPGDLVPVDHEQMTPLAPIRTVLHARNQRDTVAVAVVPHARLSEIGTLELWCSQTDRNRSWRMEFDIRSATQTDRSSHTGVAERQGFLDEATWEECRRLVEGTFGPRPCDAPAGLVRRLSAAIGSGRNEWPASLLRRLWDALIEHAEGRCHSQAHETRWLNLLGFSLRPGYGLAVDDWRVDMTWRTVQGGLMHRARACVAESWILWRRIGAGLQAGQQRALANPPFALVRGLHRRLTTGRGRGSDTTLLPHESAELWRLLGSLELLDTRTKIELGTMILDLLPKKKMRSVRAALVWAVGRLAARVPLHGPLNIVLGPDQAAVWVERLIACPEPSPIDFLAAMQLARRTNDRYRDLPDAVRDKVLDWFQRHTAPAHLIELVRQGGTLDDQEQVDVFGEALPKGLRVC